MRHLTQILLLTTLLCTCGPTQKTTAPPPALGTATNPITYEEFEEIAPLFQQTNDTTYVINFWATWCKPCREEIKLLQQLAEKTEGQAIEVVLVSLDREETALKRIPGFLAETGPDLNSIVLLDENDATWGKTIDRVWSGSLPTTIIYKGQLRYVYRRAFNTLADLERAVEPLIVL